MLKTVNFLYTFWWSLLKKFHGCSLIICQLKGPVLIITCTGNINATLPKLSDNLDLEYLSQFFINSFNQGHFWNLLVMRILKLSLIKILKEKFQGIFKDKVITPFFFVSCLCNYAKNILQDIRIIRNCQKRLQGIPLLILWTVTK